MRLPDHIGIIPDGNRRWAQKNGLSKDKGYQHGLQPGLELYRLCKQRGIKEITYYGFTMDNTKRPSKQTKAFRQACVDAVEMLAEEDASLLVVGNQESPLFPQKLLKYTTRTDLGTAKIKVNFLVNYGWKWDLNGSFENILIENEKNANKKKNTKVKNTKLPNLIHSRSISRIDLIIRWGNRRRLSGFLPLQSVYADFFIIRDLWPDFKKKHLHKALTWYDKQDPTYGG